MMKSQDKATNTGMDQPSSLTNMESYALSKEQAMDCLRKAKVGGMVLGTIIGCFLESAMLGACWVVSSMYSESDDRPAKDSQAAIIGITLWCLVTGAGAATICFMLRNLVWAVFVSTFDYETADTKTRRVAERLMDKIVKTVDAWYGAGCVAGMCTFWSLTYIVLGLQEHIMQSFWVGFLASAVWFFMSWGSNASNPVDDIFNEPRTTKKKNMVKGPTKQSKRNAEDPPVIEIAIPLLSKD